MNLPLGVLLNRRVKSFDGRALMNVMKRQKVKITIKNFILLFEKMESINQQWIWDDKKCFFQWYLKTLFSRMLSD